MRFSPKFWENEMGDIDLRCEQSVNVSDEINRLLAEHFTLVRHHKHRVFVSKDGKHVVVLSGSPGDHRTCRNELSTIRRTLRSMGVLS